MDNGKAATFCCWCGSISRDNQSKIDIVAEDENDKNMILCECKWGGFLVTAEEVDVHQKKVKLVGEPENFQYILFVPDLPPKQ